jgi:FAD/FMN-containing dehydrogenase
VTTHDRRAFLALVLGALGGRAAGQAQRGAGASPAPPRFEGQLASTARHLRAAADDWGRAVHRMPAAVLRPRTVGDVVRAVAYARERGLKVAMRGQGHCVSGQAQAAGGLVIDSSPLNHVAWHGTRALDAQAGALWRDVASRALTARRALPVLTDALVLSVGGTLSAGGTGDTSYRAGAQVDHVLELDVVTGTGALETCSPDRNRELFEMALGGMGQCGLIVRARLRLVEAPHSVELRRLAYADLGRLLADQVALCDAPIATLEGQITPEEGGRWSLSLLVGAVTRGDAGGARPGWLSGLGFAGEDAPASARFWDHIDRRTKRLWASRLEPRPHPSLAMVLPEPAAAGLLADIMSSASDRAGIWRIEVFPMVRERFVAPLHRLPEGPLSFTVRLQREASAEGAPDHHAMLESNRRLAARMRAAGGKVYPPFAPEQSPEDWREHYGPDLWARLAAAKARFDPDGLLTPGPGVFGGSRT